MAIVTIIVPVYNEAATIGGVLDKLREVDFGPADKEVIVVDGDSNDGTRDILRSLTDSWLSVVYEEARRGKGVAVAEGIRQSHGDAIIIQDADLEYDPRDIPAIVQPILDGASQVVYGSRFIGTIEHMTKLRQLANRFLTLSVNVLYGSRLTDACTCYKALEGDYARSLELETPSFDVCLEITGRALRSGLKIAEVPIHYHARGRGDGVKSSWLELPRALFTAVKFRFKPMRQRKAASASGETVMP